MYMMLKTWAVWLTKGYRTKECNSNVLLHHFESLIKSVFLQNDLRLYPNLILNKWQVWNNPAGNITKFRTCVDFEQIKFRIFPRPKKNIAFCAISITMYNDVTWTCLHAVIPRNSPTARAKCNRWSGDKALMGLVYCSPCYRIKQIDILPF